MLVAGDNLACSPVLDQHGFDQHPRRWLCDRSSSGERTPVLFAADLATDHTRALRAIRTALLVGQLRAHLLHGCLATLAWAPTQVGGVPDCS